MRRTHKICVVAFLKSSLMMMVRPAGGCRTDRAAPYADGLGAPGQKADRHLTHGEDGHPSGERTPAH
ncbi:MAG TPA: hypothetical protein VM620_07735 [Hyphomicrobium sp.]|nr:hypothetical protein [Hyphomicrobium sp.]